MRFTGQIRLPDIDHPGIPAMFLIEDKQAEMVIDGESLGRWSLYDIHVRRLVASAFEVDLAGEEITFLADEPVDFAYVGVEHMAAVWARLRSMSSLWRAVAVRRTRKGTEASRVSELRDAMMENLGAPPTKVAGLTDPPPVAREPEKGTVAERIAQARGAAEPVTQEQVGVPSGEEGERHGVGEADLEEHQRLVAEAEAKRLEAERLVAEAEARLAERERQIADAKRREGAERAAETERLEAERVEAERVEVERAEEERREQERLEVERAEAERVVQERAEEEEQEKERVEVERAEEEEQERLEAERVEAERVVQERAEEEEQEKERVEVERAEEEEQEKERVEVERAEEEEQEKERVEVERAEEEEQEKERVEVERVVQERAEGDDSDAGRGLVVDLSDLEEAARSKQLAEPEPEPEPVLAGTPEKPGLMGAVRAAFVRGSRSHSHEFVSAPGGLGITRQVCVECGYVSISVSDGADS